MYSNILQVGLTCKKQTINMYIQFAKALGQKLLNSSRR